MDNATRVEQLADISTIGAGAAAEKFAEELKAVLDNIRDPNTEAEGKRKIIMEWSFIPSEDRELVKTTITAKSVFAATKPTSELLFVGRQGGENVATVMHGGPQEDPRQGVLPIEGKGK